jgi:GGDEF domain-containing protein
MTKAELLKELAELKQDKAFGILTRPALEIEHRKQTQAAAVIFLDLDKIHNLNERIGHEAVNRKIKRAVNIRHDDLLLSGRWYSGDELVFLVKGNAPAMAERILNSLKKQGLSATIATAPLTRQLTKAVEKAKAKVENAKRANARGKVIR